MVTGAARICPARASSTLSTSETWMPVIPWSRIAGSETSKDLWIRTIAEMPARNDGKPAVTELIGLP